MNQEAKDEIITAKHTLFGKLVANKDHLTAEEHMVMNMLAEDADIIETVLYLKKHVAELN